MTEMTREAPKWVQAKVSKTVTTSIHLDDTTLPKRLNEVYYEAAFADQVLTSGFISQLRKLYEFRDSLVENFLEENPSLGDLLFGAYSKIREYFIPDVEIALEVVADPEALGDQQLFVLIRTELPRKEARAHLAELDREWWLNALPATEGKMEIALE